MVGNPRKPFRKNITDITIILERLCKLNPDILIMHEGPRKIGSNDAEQIQLLNKTIIDNYKGLVICGHKVEDHPLYALTENVQVLNTAERVFLFSSI
ncbi:hypothetical protein ACFL0J_08275 [Candidatus Neomarinimicrobiota bacterium]